MSKNAKLFVWKITKIDYIFIWKISKEVVWRCISSEK